MMFFGKSYKENINDIELDCRPALIALKIGLFDYQKPFGILNKKASI